MQIKLWNELIGAIGCKNLNAYGVQDSENRWKKYEQIDLSCHSQKQIQHLMEMVGAHLACKGAKTVLADCKLWLSTLSGDKTKPRSVQQFEAMLIQTLIRSADKNKAEGRTWEPRVYRRDDERGVWLCYYVKSTEFHPERKERDYYHAAYAEMKLVWTEFGGRDGLSVGFEAEDCIGITVEEALARKGYVLESAQLYTERMERQAKWEKWVDKIGKQFMAIGCGTDDCDGNQKKRDSSWYWNRTKSIQLDKAGEPSRVVVDVFFENDKDEDRRHNNRTHLEKLWWHRRKVRGKRDGDNDESGDLEDEIDDYDSVPLPEIPLHPYLACFDLKRHLRLRIDVGQLTEYVYDPHLSSKLILPSDSRNLVEMLLAHKGQFRDIVKGKSGGAIILCAGIPGTGKTLTAEVYAEVMARPLYTVQASQLGTDPDTLEDELLKAFARASRWNAIMLLDEADVYVHTRGNDLQQNAIVGVFLRVLEYYKGVLFLTTNRSDLVDDAIASRCVARIDYKAPTPEDQTAIWKVLASTAEITIDPDVIDAIVKRYPDLTGRDVKNLLKLAKLVSDSRECPITEDVLRFVKRFKPTTNKENEEEEPVHLPPMPEREEMAAEPEDEPEAPQPGPGMEVALDWRALASSVFEDGAPHAPSEVKEAVAEADGKVHPNAVTVLIQKMVKAGKLERLPSGLYQLR